MLFKTRLSEEEKKKLKKLKEGQSPSVMLVTCSDSRILPDRIFDADFGEIFVFRNMGNVIPPYEKELENPTGIGAFLEYGVKKLGARVLVVLGHTECGAVKGFLSSPDSGDDSLVSRYLREGKEVKQIIQERIKGASFENALAEGVRTNTLLQAERAKKYPVIRESGAKVHAWIYHIDTGEVEVLF